MSADPRLEDQADAEHATAGPEVEGDDWTAVATCSRPMLPRFPGQAYRDRCGGLIRDGACTECGRPHRTP